MKRNLSLGLGLLAFALMPALAQTGKPTGKIHGQVTNPSGAVQATGTISLSTDGGQTSKYTFPISADGTYAGVAAQGTYSLIFRQPDTPANKMVDMISNVKIVAGEDTLQDDDMSRPAFIKTLSPDQQKKLAELREHNSAALKANTIIRGINADIVAVNQDVVNANNAHDAAVAALGATASKEDIKAKTEAIKTASYSAIETLMLKDTAVLPSASVLWVQLGQAQIGLKKYDDAIVSYNKVLALEAAAKPPSLANEGTAYSGLGEAYARTGKVPEAKAAFDNAAKINPTAAPMYLKNEAIIFFQEGNTDAEAAAAEEAIQADPTMALAYYLRGNGLVAATTMDPKTQKLVPPPGCMEAYQKYLDLDPNGPYAGEVKQILASFGQTVETSYKASKKKR